MNTTDPLRSPAFAGVRSSQRGTVLLLTLIVLVVLLIGGVALVRSFDTTLLTAGNIAFKRDLVNQGERVVPTLIGPNGLFQAAGGPLSSAAARAASKRDNNYSATILPTSPQGVPLALLSNDAFATVGDGANDIRVGEGAAVTSVRYVVDRMCNDVGLDTDLGSAKCILADSQGARGGSGSALIRAEEPAVGGSAGGGAGGGNEPGALPQQVIYRISVRVDGPRGTQTFLQTTFAL